MIKINPIDDLLKEQYYNVAKEIYISFLKNICSNDDYVGLVEYLDFKDGNKPTYNESRLRKIIIGERESLAEIIRKIGHKPKNKCADNCYEQFAGMNFMRSWAKKIGVGACPYCNINYVNSSSDNSTRSEFDHFYPKSIYPYLCISMYNLIPCCHDCNHKKLSLDTQNTPFAYPYADEFGQNIVFDVSVLKDKSLADSANPEVNHLFDLNVIDKNGENLPKPVANEIKQLRLIERYLSTQYDINQAYNKVIKYNDKYCNSILRLKIFKHLRPDPYDFCDVVDKNGWVKKTMSKLKYDIYMKFKK